MDVDVFTHMSVCVLPIRNIIEAQNIYGAVDWSQFTPLWIKINRSLWNWVGKRGHKYLNVWFTTITPQGFNSPSTFAVDDQCMRLRDRTLRHSTHIHIESKEINKTFSHENYFASHLNWLLFSGIPSVHHLMKFGCSLMKHFIACTGIL